MFINPQNLLSGYFASENNVLFLLKPMQWISAFRYSYQALSESEFTDIQPLNCFYTESTIPNVSSACNPLQDRFKYSISMMASIIMLVSLIIGFKLLAFIILFVKAKYKK